MGYKVGDRVRIINYGHWLYSPYPLTRFPLIGEKLYDIAPELVGLEGTINKADKTQNQWQYGITFDNGKNISWFTDDQLELIE